MGYIGADPALNESVTSAQIADDAITLAKMASGTDGAMITYDTSGNPVAITGTDGQVATSAGADAVSAFEAAPSIDGITDNSNANAITIDSSENVAIDSGNLEISTSGKGIDFSATSNASGTGVTMTSELLDDYEEGTWTPKLGDGTSEAGTSTAVGTYTKVGNLVTANCFIRVNDIGSVSGDTIVTTLPFATNGTSGRYGHFTSVYGAGLSVTAGHNVVGYVNPGGTSILLQNWDVTTGTSRLQHDQVSTDGDLMLHGQYIV